MKYERKDYINLVFLLLIYIIFILIVTRFKYLFGSSMDWENQHVVFPDYFRKQFYRTGDLFPSFSLNIGGGQNIYNFSYYGLYNPIIMFSYFLPFISMTNYIIATSLMSVFVSVVLLYYWLRKNDFKAKICFVCTLLFLLSGPLIFHSHRHIMFVNYFPFLILSFINIDKYFKNKRIAPFIISVSLIILCSYYFAIGALVTLGIYTLYKLVQQGNVNFKSCFLKSYPLVIAIVVAILISSLLLIPTVFVIGYGRDNVAASIPLYKILLPYIETKRIGYSSYSIGLTISCFFALIINVIRGQKGVRFLSIILILPIVFPLGVWLLNGGQYLVPKTLIPLLPLYILMDAKCFARIERRDYMIKPSLIVMGISGGITILCCHTQTKVLIFAETICTMLALFISHKVNRRRVVFCTICLFALINCFSINIRDNTLILAKEYYIENDEDKEQLIKRTLDDDTSFYRFSTIRNDIKEVNRIRDVNFYDYSVYSSLSNQYYTKFFYKFSNNVVGESYGQCGASSNNLFWNYMGVKYLVGKNSSLPVKYEGKHDKIFYNEKALPIIHAKEKKMSQKYFETLEYPDNIDALLNYTIVNRDIESEYVSKMDKVGVSFDDFSKLGLIYKKNGNKIKIKSKKNNYMKYKFADNLEGKFILLSFNIAQNSCQRWVDVNGIRNTISKEKWTYNNRNQTFYYCIDNLKNGLNISFSPGEYDVEDLKIYIYDNGNINIDSLEKANLEFNNVSGDSIKGSIVLSKDNYVKTTIPYDDNFQVFVDGKKVKKELIDTAFVGFYAEEGEHNFEIKYVNKVEKTSYAFSISGSVIFIAIYIYECKKRFSLENINLFCAKEMI